MKKLLSLSFALVIFMSIIFSMPACTVNTTTSSTEVTVSEKTTTSETVSTKSQKDNKYDKLVNLKKGKEFTDDFLGDILEISSENEKVAEVFETDWGISINAVGKGTTYVNISNCVEGNDYWYRYKVIVE